MTITGTGDARSSWLPFWIVLVFTAILMVFETALSRRLAGAADESKVNPATGHVETGAHGIGAGVEETAIGNGHAVGEGAKYSGQKIQAAGKAAEPQVKGAGEKVRDGAVSFGQSVKTYFTRMFGN